MRILCCVLSALALAACSAGTKEYEMSVDEASSKLLGSHFEKGILPGSSSHRPIVHRNYEGNLEWQVSTTDDLAHANGWWCPLSIEPAGEDGKNVRVVNKCVGMLASKDNKNLDELVDATLTGRPPKFDE